MNSAISPALGMGEKPPFPYCITACNLPATWRKANGRVWFFFFLEAEFTHAVFQHSVINLSRQPGCARTNRTSNKQCIKMKHAVDACSHSAPAAQPPADTSPCSMQSFAFLHPTPGLPCRSFHCRQHLQLLTSLVQMQQLCLVDAFHASPAILLRNVSA